MDLKKNPFWNKGCLGESARRRSFYLEPVWWNYWFISAVDVRSPSHLADVSLPHAAQGSRVGLNPPWVQKACVGSSLFALNRFGLDGCESGKLFYVLAGCEIFQAERQTNGDCAVSKTNSLKENKTQKALYLRSYLWQSNCLNYTALDLILSAKLFKKWRNFPPYWPSRWLFFTLQNLLLFQKPQKSHCSSEKLKENTKK